MKYSYSKWFNTKQRAQPKTVGASGSGFFLKLLQQKSKSKNDEQDLESCRVAQEYWQTFFFFISQGSKEIPVRRFALFAVIKSLDIFN